VLDFSVLNLIKGLVAIVAQLLTSSIGSFALARAGYLTGSRPVSTTVPDELAESAAHNTLGRLGDDTAHKGQAD